MMVLQPGSVFAGYTIERRLGAGGWGTVYLARDRPFTDSRFTALKLLDRAVGDGESQQRFLREGDLVAQVDRHPNIVTVYNRGVENDVLWISMEYVAGSDASVLTGLPADQAVRIITEVAAALDYAHGADVLHRDVKPANILLGEPRDGLPARVVLTDFGIARRLQDEARLTMAGSVNGTAAFMAPEQVSGGEVGPWSDQYSLGCTLFQLLTDEPVYEAREVEALIFAHVQGTPRAVSEFRPGLRALDPVLARALARNPSQRFASCTEFATAAAQALRGERIAAAVAPLPAPRPPLEATVQTPVPAPGDERPAQGDQDATAPAPPAGLGRRPRVKLLGMVVAVLLAIGAAVMVPTVLGQDGDTTATTVDPSSYSESRAVKTFDRLLPSAKDGLGFQDATCVQLNEATDPVAGKSSYRIDCTQPDGLNFVVFDYLTAESAAQQLRDVCGCARPETTPLITTDDRGAFYSVHAVPGIATGTVEPRMRMGFTDAPWSSYVIEIDWPEHADKYLIEWAQSAPL